MSNNNYRRLESASKAEQGLVAEAFVGTEGSRRGSGSDANSSA